MKPLGPQGSGAACHPSSSPHQQHCFNGFTEKVLWLSFPALPSTRWLSFIKYMFLNQVSVLANNLFLTLRSKFIASSTWGLFNTYSVVGGFVTVQVSLKIFCAYDITDRSEPAKLHHHMFSKY